MCIAAAQDMQALLAQNRRLISELNAMHVQVAGTAISIQPTPVSESMMKLMDVKHEVFGQFPAGFGDNWAYQSGVSHSWSSATIPNEGQDTRWLRDASIAVSWPACNAQVPNQEEFHASFHENPCATYTSQQQKDNLHDVAPLFNDSLFDHPIHSQPLSCTVTFSPTDDIAGDSLLESRLESQSIQLASSSLDSIPQFFAESM